MKTLEKILEKMKEIKDRNRKENLYAKYPAENNKQEKMNIYSQGYEDGTDNFYNGLESFICSHMNEVASLQNKVVVDILNGLADWWYAEAPINEGEEKSETLKVLEQVQGFVETFLNEDVDEKSGWIPVSERLPNKEEFMKAYCRNAYSAEFIVMIKDATLPTTLYFKNGSWVDTERNYYDVVAWQPLPEAYREEPQS